MQHSVYKMPDRVCTSNFPYILVFSAFALVTERHGLFGTHQ